MRAPTSLLASVVLLLEIVPSEEACQAAREDMRDYTGSQVLSVSGGRLTQDHIDFLTSRE